MIRKFNYTGRKKIDRDNISIRLVRDTTPHPYFDLKISLNPEDFPDDAELIVEAYDRSSFMRFKCGSLKSPVFPEDRHLTEIHSTNAILFRVKVVDPTTQHGKILAAADRLTSVGESQEDARRISLLPVSYADLGKEVWKLDFWNTGPVLILNKRIESVSVSEIVKTSDLFFSLVYPSVLREILVHILVIDDTFEEEDPELWQNLWIRFVESLPDVPKITGTSEFENSSSDPAFFLNWIDNDVIPAFCRKYMIKEKFESEIVRV
jgi:hypothetical protein